MTLIDLIDLTQSLIDGVLFGTTYALIGSPQGTTLTRHVDGVPVPEYALWYP